MNGYKAFYNGKQADIYADTTLKARDKAATLWKVPTKKHYMISVVLCELDGKQVTHTPDF